MKQIVSYPHIVYEIEALLSEREREKLYELGQANQGGVIVEIGSYKGGSTVCLALGSLAGKGGRVYAIDPHLEGTESTFRASLKLARVEDVVEPIVMTSQEAIKGWDRPIGLLFVDGAHDTDNVRFDLTEWVRHVVPEGTIAIHDWLRFKTVTNGIRRYTLRPGGISRVTVVHTLLVASKGYPDIPVLQRVWLTALSYLANAAPVSPRLSPLYERARRFSRR